MTLAADLLVEREAATIAEVARTVGYSDAFAFSAAFKRIRGVNPSEFRRTGSRPREYGVVPESTWSGSDSARDDRVLAGS